MFCPNPCHSTKKKDIIYLISYSLELCILWCTWERNHVTDVLHTSYEENQTLETETETCVWA